MLEKYSDLTDSECYFILDKFAQLKSPENVKKVFENFFYPKKVDGNLILQVIVKNKNELEKLKEKYENNLDDIPIANRRNRILLYHELYTECLKPQIVAVDKQGNPIEKVDRETARKCLDSVGREMAQWEILKNKILPNQIPMLDPGEVPQIEVKIKNYDE